MAKRFLICALAILVCGTALSAAAPATKAASAVSPTIQFMFAWGSVSIGGVPAPAGTVVEAVGRVGNMAGQFTVWYPGFYGAMAVYGVPSEMLALLVNGVPAGKFQWTQFGAVTQLDLVVGTAIKTGSATISGTATASASPSPASSTKTTATAVKKRSGKK